MHLYNQQRIWYLVEKVSRISAIFEIYCMAQKLISCQKNTEIFIKLTTF
jgi:hypothetical protein